MYTNPGITTYMVIQSIARNTLTCMYIQLMSTYIYSVVTKDMPRKLGYRMANKSL